MRHRRSTRASGNLLAGLAAIVLLSALGVGSVRPGTPPVHAQGAPHDALFQTAADCMACHNGLTTPSGEDVSIGSAWRATMMANSARDPYWQAAVRRETIDHPRASDHIEDECSVCHMPMARTYAAARGRLGRVFAHLPIDRAGDHEARLAADGVSCTLCHQITGERLGTPESFTGGYVIDLRTPAERRLVFGPFAISPGHTRIMQSATGFRPSESAHVRESELCATCHTLYTTARGPDGQTVGTLPEQVPYLEWRHSEYRTEQSCQSCHMPVIEEPTPIASVLGEPRAGAARHVFRGGNFFMLRMLNRYRADLGVEATPQELDSAARATVAQLQNESATVAITNARIEGGRVLIDVAVTNLAGHKLPTAYPLRRAWLRLTVRDGSGRTVFESGGITEAGLIAGNDNDADPATFEPHYAEISRADEVQVYESVMADARGTPTTGLLSGVRFVKDNRLLPRGFDKATAPDDIRVRGRAGSDDDFTAGGDRIRYAIDPAGTDGPFEIQVELRYQPIGYRWAQNLRSYDAPETRRFVTYFESMSASSSERLAHASTVVRRP